MPFTNKKYDQVENYLKGNISPEDKKLFEKELSENTILRNEVENQKNLLVNLEFYKERKALKNKLDKIHGELDKGSLKEQLSQPILLMNKLRTREFVYTVAAAASIALLFTFAALYVSGFFRFNQKAADYTQLKNEMDKISSGQNRLWHAFSNMEEKKKPLVATGTCFSITSNGYFVTNYHVVKGVDSIFIAHKNDSDLKYKVRLVYKDIKNDIAILMIDDPRYIMPVRIPYTFKKSLADLGDYVYTLGYSKKDVVFSEGSLSSLSGFNEDSTAYQVAMPVNPGSSGSPLINENGELLGMITGKNYRKDGATYAIKSSYILSIVDSISKDTSLVKPVLTYRNQLRGKKRVEQVKVIQPFIYKVEIYQ